MAIDPLARADNKEILSLRTQLVKVEKKAVRLESDNRLMFSILGDDESARWTRLADLQRERQSAIEYGDKWCGKWGDMKREREEVHTSLSRELTEANTALDMILASVQFAVDEMIHWEPARQGAYEILRTVVATRAESVQRGIDLQREVEHLRERCTSDPWWWAYSEYLDEGWCGPFLTREQAEASADDELGPPRPDDDPPRCADDERPEVSYRQASNPEGCAENERLQREVERLSTALGEVHIQRGMLQANNEQLKDECSGQMCDECNCIPRQHNEQLREAARPFLSLQSPDHSERIAGLIHKTYFDKLRIALAQPKSPQPDEPDPSGG